jgi:hypothetical protein
MIAITTVIGVGLAKPSSAGAAPAAKKLLPNAVLRVSLGL